MEYIHLEPIQKLADAIEDLLTIQHQVKEILATNITYDTRRRLHDVRLRTRSVINLLSKNSDRFLAPDDKIFQ